MCEDKVNNADILLDWYDFHARKMPWRVSPKDRKAGIVPDPYHVWMSEIMLQQTTVAAVRAYFLKFTEQWPTVFDLAAAKDDDVMAAWAGLGYYARARNLLKCARRVAHNLGGVFPKQETELRDLPGIGHYTAAAIAAIAFDQSANVVDGNVERVMARYHAIKAPLPGSKPVLKDLAASMLPKARFGDYAQGLMDLGATICTPKNPACGICPWMQGCKARGEGLEKTLPAKVAKAVKPTRYGICFVILRKDGAVLLERRPEQGLLGGMYGWPGTEWGKARPPTAPPFPSDWHTVSEDVHHTFTHFHLKLRVLKTVVSLDFNWSPGKFFEKDQFNPDDLPTVMRKVWALAYRTS